MRQRKTLLLFTALASTILMSGASVGAQSPRFRSDILVRGTVYPGGLDDIFLTFSGPVTIPGATLRAGTYIFRLVSPGVLQVASTDRMHIYAMTFTSSAVRDNATDEYQVWLASQPRQLHPESLPGSSRTRKSATS